ncbi:hypothetical protein F5148DRAFT_988094, partial [Russula earlei]
QTLGLATSYSEGFQIGNFSADGLMGMGFLSISVFNAVPPLQTLISENMLTSPMFGIKLATLSSDLFLGGINNSLFMGDFSWVSLSNAVCHQ